MALFGKMGLETADVDMDAVDGGGGRVAGVAAAEGGMIRGGVCAADGSATRDALEIARLNVGEGEGWRALTSDWGAFLFDSSGVSGGCIARKRGTDPAQAVLVQCTGLRVSGGQFCKNHKAGQPFGIWDPPGHESLPQRKRDDAIAVAKGRASEAAVWQRSRATPKTEPNKKSRAHVQSRCREGHAIVPEDSVESRPVSASAAPSRPPPRRGRARIATGLGAEHCADWRAEETRREVAGVVLGMGRRDAGVRGRLTDLSGEDLDRGAGGAWRAGR